MYGTDITCEKKFQERFYRLKEHPNTDETFLLIKDYVVSVETNVMNQSIIFSNSNPLNVDKSTRLFIREFNAYCLEFLVRMASALADKKTSSKAHVYLGLTYELGLFGITKNPKNSFNYYIVSAKQNNKFGTYRLAQAYEKQKRTKDGYTKALYFYRCAAKLGCIYGMHTYGSILLRGDLNSNKEFDTGLFYLKLASRKANTSYPYPFYDLGQVYESSNSCSDIDADDDYAFKMYERGCNLGCPNSLYRLGKCFELGQLFKTPNMKIAIEYYKRAADKGHMDAQYLMSKFFFTGLDGVLSVNYNQSFTYALLAAARGHPEGAYSAGEFFEKGYGMKKNPLLALWWYTISSSLGYKNAETRMNKLRNSVNIDNIGPSRQYKSLCGFC
ncbi:hypothetical protein NCER_100623 [Vairimorpha ceranae BRL01]|uniref:Skt5-like protein n=2 Tax=Vairimorpha ceranae TaxID=40302 RepID=C4V822_VAIC1|nr:skt5-like protein [Vairimorpha ceranae]EEQ82625.1 hypothetical protein NCER_100623 [Vairimorpha ceranae BRL01]KAF5139771.1 hypothetical protein G9O61_00g020540 [Vairimorpha ceranae]KKO75125.1 skt5-like protein [Vairimorpha ceranae]